jgi:membrane-associated protease RseP (regulator of RpoE activity)
MRKTAIVWTVVGILIGTSIGLAAEYREHALRKDKESAANDTGRPSQAYLGIGIEPLHPALVSQLPKLIPNGHGVLIAQVAKGSPAEKAGLEKHDIVLEYGKQEIRSPEQFVKLVHKDKPGREATLHVIRGGKATEVNVVLGEAKNAKLPLRHSVLRPFWEQTHKRRITPEQEQVNWSTFDSMALTRMDENRYRAEIKYRDQEGKIDTRTYEGTREDIQKSIESAKDMPDAERAHLLRALDMPGSDLEFGPAVYMTPEGQVIWDFEGLTP